MKYRVYHKVLTYIVACGHMGHMLELRDTFYIVIESKVLRVLTFYISNNYCL